MQTLTPIRPRFARPLSLNPLLSLSLRPSTARAFSSSSSSSDFSNQSRGGLPRFFSELIPASKGGVVRVQGDEFWHMTKVLRLRANDRVELFNGKGSLIQGLIQSVDRSGLDFVALEDPKLVLPQNTQWHVFAGFGTLKGGRADWLVQTCKSKLTFITYLKTNHVMEYYSKVKYNCISVSINKTSRKINIRFVPKGENLVYERVPSLFAPMPD